MGLDMSLYRQKRNRGKLSARIRWNEATEVAYWRKANAIHKWFVDNIQDHQDDCGEYIVPREKLVELLETVEEVLDSTYLAKGKVRNGWRFIKIFGKLVKKYNYEDGKVVKRARIAKKLLPTSEGFFFGSTDYNESYYRDLKYTRDVLREILHEYNDKEVIIYSSSW